ncbi:MAG: hypothetical protein MSIBF_02205 [Candidatus Altiarchaeales archaeon IMC4]|nr:MAG: hypothetical protein MSIBF_02205 [Candidatus Altiarchaeales archaeon IMC4]
MDNKGYVYTIITVTLSIMLLLFVSFYIETSKIKTDDVSSRIGTDELHYYVESTRKDTERAVEIFGRRAAIYVIDAAIYKSNHTDNVTVGINDSVSTIKTLILNGTFVQGGEVIDSPYMQNHTLEKWIQRLNNRTSDRFVSEIEVLDIEVVPHDPWRFAVIMWVDMDIRERNGNSLYSGSDVFYTMVSVAGLEDPLYPLKTQGRVTRYINPVTEPVYLESLKNGTYYNAANTKGGGIVFNVVVESGNGNAAAQRDNITSYNGTISETLFIVNMSGDELNDTSIRDRINQSAGVISYDDSDINLSVAYVSNISELALQTGDWAAINDGKVYRVYINDYIDQGAYFASNTSPCFFDRLEGNLDLSQKYVYLARIYFDVWIIGMESIKDRYVYCPGINQTILEMDCRCVYMNTAGCAEGSGVMQRGNYSSIDYLHLEHNESLKAGGKRIYGTPSWFRLDANHTTKYGLDGLDY